MCLDFSWRKHHFQWTLLWIPMTYYYIQSDYTRKFHQSFFKTYQTCQVNHSWYDPVHRAAEMWGFFSLTSTQSFCSNVNQCCGADEDEASSCSRLTTCESVLRFALCPDFVWLIGEKELAEVGAHKLTSLTKAKADTSRQFPPNQTATNEPELNKEQDQT